MAPLEESENELSPSNFECPPAPNQVEMDEDMEIVSKPEWYAIFLLLMNLML
jgi:hypothetical protein